MDRPYVRPTPNQRALLVAYVELGTVAKAAAKLGLTEAAAYSQIADARRRSGLTLVRLIYAGTRDGWLVPETAI